MTIPPPFCCEHIVCAITLSSKLDYCNAMQDIGCPAYFTVSSLILTLLVAGIPVTVIVEPVLTHHPLPGCQRHCTSLSILSTPPSSTSNDFDPSIMAYECLRSVTYYTLLVPGSVTYRRHYLCAVADPESLNGRDELYLSAKIRHNWLLKTRRHGYVSLTESPGGVFIAGHTRIIIDIR